MSPNTWGRVDEACDRFEQAWQKGETPAIAEFLTSTAGDERRKLLHELLRLDRHHRGQSGNSKSEDDYAAELSQDEATVREFFRQSRADGGDTKTFSDNDSTQTFSHAANGSRNADQLPRWSAARFRTIRSYAKGGLGEVFLAEDLEFQREVALKEIQRSKLDNPMARSDFSREGRVTGRLEHPNIAPVYSLGEFEDGRPFYVMRFIRGASLKDAIARFHGTAPLRTPPKDRPAPEANCAHAEKTETTASPHNRDLQLRQLLTRFVQVCNAVAFAHSKGVIHRDIKPANIMLGDFGETLLVDWGLARGMGDVEEALGITADLQGNADAATLQGQIKGTPAYMSPEQARGEIDKLGPATDIYSLGGTLYTVLTGEVPAAGKSTAEILKNVSTGAITPPRLRAPQQTIPRPLDAVCMKAMALAPASRYATAKELADDIEHFLADEPVTALAEPITVKTRRWLRKHPALATAATLLLLVGLAGSLAFAALERSHGDAMTKKNGELSKAKEHIERKRKEAEENFKDAKTAVDRYVKTVQKAELLKEERFKPLLKELLKDASEFYEKFIQRSQNRPDRAEDLALALILVSQISSENGDIQVAINATTRAVELLRQLTLANSNDLKLQSYLSRCYINLGAFQQGTSDLASALKSYVQGIALLERLAQENPMELEFQSSLMRSYGNFGSLQHYMSDLTGAQSSYGRAIAIGERLVESNPSVSEFQDDLMRIYTKLGGLQSAVSKLPSARISYDRAIDLGDKLVQENPSVAQFRSGLVESILALGTLQQSTLDLDGALTSYDRAVAMAEKLAQENPTVAKYQAFLVKVHGNLGVLHASTKELVSARHSFDRTIALGENLVKENPSVTEYQSSLAKSYINLAVFQYNSADPEGGRASYVQAIDLLERLTLENHIVAAHQHNLASALVNLAFLELGTARYAQGRELLLRAEPFHRSALQSNAANATYREFFRNNRRTLFSCCVALHIFAEAMAAAREWAEHANDTADALNAAAHICKCITLAKKDESLSDEAKKEAVQEYGDAAVGILTKLVKEGVNGERLTDPAVFNRPEFLPLTLRKDFQELVASLEKTDQ